MTTSLYDHPIHGEKKYKSSSGIGDYDDDDNYDAIRDAKEKFRRNPDKYSPRRTHGLTNVRSSRREVTRVTLVIEHGGGCTSQGVSDDIRLGIEDTYPDVRLVEKHGMLDSFEVYINGRRLYSRLSQGGYPYEDEVVEAVYRAKKGKTFYPLERGSTVCSIL